MVDDTKLLCGRFLVIESQTIELQPFNSEQVWSLQKIRPTHFILLFDDTSCCSMPNLVNGCLNRWVSLAEKEY